MNALFLSGFWFLLGFMVASVMAYKANLKQRAKAAQSFQAAKNEVLRLLDSMRDLTEIRVTIRDETGELKVETDVDDDLVPKPAKDLH